MMTYREKFENILKEKMAEKNHQCNNLLLSNLVEMGLYNIMKKPYYKGIYDEVRLHLMFKEKENKEFDFQHMIDENEVDENSPKWGISVEPPDSSYHKSYNHVHNDLSKSYIHMPYVDDKELLFLEKFNEQLNGFLTNGDKEVQLSYLNELMSYNHKQYFLLGALFSHRNDDCDDMTYNLFIELGKLLVDKLKLNEKDDLFKEEYKEILEQNHVVVNYDDLKALKYLGKTKPILTSYSESGNQSIQNHLNYEFDLNLFSEFIDIDDYKYLMNKDDDRNKLMAWKERIEGCIKNNKAFRKHFGNELAVVDEAMKEMMVRSPELKRSPRLDDVECEFVLFDFYTEWGYLSFSVDDDGEKFWHDGKISRITLDWNEFVCEQDDLYEVFYGVDALDLGNMKAVMDDDYLNESASCGFELMNRVNKYNYIIVDDNEMMRNMKFWSNVGKSRYAKSKISSLLMMKNKANGDLIGVVEMYGDGRNGMMLKMKNLQINKNYLSQGFGSLLMEELSDLLKRENKLLIYDEQNFNEVFRKWVGRYEGVLSLGDRNPLKSFLHHYFYDKKSEPVNLKSRDEYFKLLAFCKENPHIVRKFFPIKNLSNMEKREEVFNHLLDEYQKEEMKIKPQKIKI